MGEHMNSNSKKLLCFILLGMLINTVSVEYLTAKTPAASAGNIYYLYVAAESQDEVDVIRFDGKIADVVKRIPVGVWPVEIEGPHGLAISPEGDYWFLSMAHGKPYGHVYKFATGTDKMIARVELGFFPATMQVSQSTGFLYVVNFNLHGDHVPSSVSVIDPESMSEIERITTGVMPHGSRLSPDGNHHYSVAMMSGELFEIDALSLEVARKLYLGKDEVPPGMHAKKDHDHKMSHAEKDGDHKMNHASSGKPMPKPTWVFPHPSKSFVYVANNGANEVVEVDLKSWKVTRRFPTGKGPYNLEVSPNGEQMAVTYKSEGATAVWDLQSGTELAKISNSRKVSHGVVISPDNRYAFVSVEGIGGEPGSLDVIDLKSLKRIAAVDVGKQAGGIVFWKMDKK